MTQKPLATEPIFAELDRLKAQFGPRFIIGLSGGGDSMALAHICAAWAKTSTADVSALIIDHGLRPEAAEEAKRAKAWAEALGLKANIHTYDGPTFSSRIQESARALRHDAFFKAATNAGGATILLGHTLDDQAETIAFRIARQTGLDGLAGMARVTTDVLDGIPIARPLLDVRRVALRDYLLESKQEWMDDPSNENLQYSRVKVRKQLEQLGGHDRLARIGALARVISEAHHNGVRDLAQRCRLKRDDSVYHFDATPFLGAAQLLQIRMVSQLLATNKPLEPAKLERLITAMHGPDFKRATLAGKIIERRGPIFTIATAPQRRIAPR